MNIDEEGLIFDVKPSKKRKKYKYVVLNKTILPSRKVLLHIGGSYYKLVPSPAEIFGKDVEYLRVHMFKIIDEEGKTTFYLSLKEVDFYE